MDKTKSVGKNIKTKKQTKMIKSLNNGKSIKTTLDIKKNVETKNGGGYPKEFENLFK